MKRLAAALLALLIALPAHAEEFADPTWSNLTRTLVRYGALDLGDDKVLDEYAMITDCDVYRAKSGNDFEWNKDRDKFRQSIEMKRNTKDFPTGYAYRDKVSLDHYDFKNHRFMFSDRTPLQKVNAFALLRTAGQACHDTPIKYLPNAFRAVLEQSVSLPGMPLTQTNADDLLRDMDANHNTDRTVYVQFNLHITHINTIGPTTDPNNSDTIFVQQGAPRGAPILMNAEIDSIDFYEFDDYSHLLYSKKL